MKEKWKSRHLVRICLHLQDIFCQVIERFILKNYIIFYFLFFELFLLIFDFVIFSIFVILYTFFISYYTIYNIRYIFFFFLVYIVLSFIYIGLNAHLAFPHILNQFTSKLSFYIFLLSFIIQLNIWKCYIITSICFSLTLSFL